jgi:hypothetical protein
MVEKAILKESKMKVQVIEAPNRIELDDNKINIFLAGGITNCPNWQKELIELLKNRIQDDNDDLVLFNPRRENFPIHIPDESLRQIEWEHDYLESCDQIVYWFSRGSLNPIALYELGRWGNSTDTKIYIGIDPQYERKSDAIIQTGLSRPEVKIVDSLKSLAHQILEFNKFDKEK